MCFIFCVMKLYPEKRPKSKWVQGAEKVRGPGMTSLLLGPLPRKLEPPGRRRSLAQALPSYARYGSASSRPRACSRPPRRLLPAHPWLLALPSWVRREGGVRSRARSLYRPTVLILFCQVYAKKDTAPRKSRNDVSLAEQEHKLF